MVRRDGSERRPRSGVGVVRFTGKEPKAVREVAVRCVGLTPTPSYRVKMPLLLRFLRENSVIVSLYVFRLRLLFTSWEAELLPKPSFPACTVICCCWFVFSFLFRFTLLWPEAWIVFLVHLNDQVLPDQMLLMGNLHQTQRQRMKPERHRKMLINSWSGWTDITWASSRMGILLVEKGTFRTKRSQFSKKKLTILHVYDPTTELSKHGAETGRKERRDMRLLSAGEQGAGSGVHAPAPLVSCFNPTSRAAVSVLLFSLLLPFPFFLFSIEDI